MNKMWACALLSAFALCASPSAAARVPDFKDGVLAVSNAPSLNSYTAEARQDHVSSLPGWGDLNEFNVFSGYITVDDKAGRHLFYTFVESKNRPSSDPLVLWLNGGPGCSSLGGGFMSELGPFYPTEQGDLEANRHSWNNVANMLFVESPAFVGFSFSETPGDIRVGDERTATDARKFLSGFYERFPQYAKHPFWLSGESYAGHYVPTLAAEILRFNEDKPAVPIPLRGLVVGNVWTDPPSDNRGALDFWFSHGLISFTVRDGLDKNCNFSYIGPLTPRLSAANDAEGTSEEDERCEQFVGQAFQQISRINIYDIYADVCLKDKPLAEEAAASNSSAPLRNELLASLDDDSDGIFSPADYLRSSVEGARRQQQARRRGSARANAITDPQYDPCVGDLVQVYFNRPEVRRAIHANKEGGLKGAWSNCNRALQYSREDLLASMLPVYEELLKVEGLDILVYSGDVDAIVPVTGTRSWIHDFKLEVKERWRPWFSATQQVGGWTVKYAEGLTFASVRGAGHMVPYTQPERALHLFTQFIHSQRL